MPSFFRVFSLVGVGACSSRYSLPLLRERVYTQTLKQYFKFWPGISALRAVAPGGKTHSQDTPNLNLIQFSSEY